MLPVLVALTTKFKQWIQAPRFQAFSIEAKIIEKTQLIKIYHFMAPSFEIIFNAECGQTIRSSIDVHLTDRFFHMNPSYGFCQHRFD
jgi:hypothetical protein